MTPQEFIDLHWSAPQIEVIDRAIELIESEREIRCCLALSYALRETSNQCDAHQFEVALLYRRQFSEFCSQQNDGAPPPPEVVGLLLLSEGEAAPPRRPPRIPRRLHRCRKGPILTPLDNPSGCAHMLTRTRRVVIGSGLPSHPETGLRYPRTIAEAFPDERAGSVSGPHRRPHRARHVIAVALLALIAWGHRMTSITINASEDPHYTTEALDRAAMLIEDVLRGREPLRIDGLSAHTGKPVSMIRAAVARGVAAGELAITPAGHIALLRCKPADTTAKTTKTHKPRKTTK